MCKFVAAELKKLVSNETEVEAVLKKVCSFLPGKLESTCNNLVNEYASEIIAVLNNASPDVLCNLIGLCKSAEVPIAKDELVEDDRAEGDLTCEMAVGELQRVLKNNNTQKENSINAVNKLCHQYLHLPCSSILMEIIDVFQNEPAEEWCSVITLCAGGARKI